jgi:DNA-binding SARP family transcriptional activator/tetratricopeptide (TPR) repeat protein
MDMEPVRVRLLGPFSITSGEREAGPWPRPTARRLCQLVLVSPGRRVSRDLVCEELFPDTDPRQAARAVSKALSMARAALTALGPAGAFLHGDSQHIWIPAEIEIDAEEQANELRDALAMPPGHDRDDRFVSALASDDELLADEPYADWAIRPRERLEALRQEARLTLARDRAKGAGRSRPEAVTWAWEEYFTRDPASEEAAVALIRGYIAAGRRQLAEGTYERCVAALDELGLRASPLLREAHAAAAPAARSTPARGGELRTVSMLAAEVTAPAGLDPARLLDIAADALSAAVSEVEALGGTVITVSGAGMQAVFGAPQAHEDDPERAVRAAFRAVTSVAEARTLRIGVETGPAVLGPIGAVGYGAVGEVVSVAAALQAAAAPGSVLVGPVTRGAIGRLFAWGDRRELPGGVTATYLRGPATTRMRRDGHGPLVGRRAELAVLDNALRDAMQGRGSVTVVSGDPGLGKTRLVREAIQRQKIPVLLEGRCTSYGSDTPYGLYRQILANWAGVAPDVPQPALRRALAKALDDRLFPPLARMMGLPEPGRMSPEDQRRAIFGAWDEAISDLASSGPVVLLLEDLHWADNTSLQLTLELADLTVDHGLAVLATSRPETAPEVASLRRPRPGGPRTHRISLDPLPVQAERELARYLLGGEVDDAVLATAEGNPLFLEERLSSLLEADALVRDSGIWRLDPNAGPEVPQVLERLVLSRVDRLSPAAREIAQRASVLGVEFTLSLLTKVCEPDLPADEAVAEMLERDLLRPVPGAPETAYRFRHALIQEAIYHGILAPERRLLHGRVAWALDAACRGSREKVAAVLGRHFAAAGENELALRYLEMAGDDATDAYANDEAISSFRSAMDLTTEPAASVRLRVKIANVLWRVVRYDETRQAFTEALRIGTPDPVLTAHLYTRLGRLELSVQRFDAADAAFAAAEAALGTPRGDAATEQWLELMIDGRAGLYLNLSRADEALATLASARPALEAHGSPARKFGYYHILGIARVVRNRYRVEEADLEIMRQSIAAARESEEKDAGYAIYLYGRFLWLRGDLDAAREQYEQALAMAERIGETNLRAWTLLGLVQVAVSRHDVDAVRALSDRALEEAETMRSPALVAAGKACLAWLAWQEGKPEEVIAQTELAPKPGQAEAWWDVHWWIGLLPLMAAYLRADRVPDAVEAVRQIQQALPDELESLLRSAVTAHDNADPATARAQLASAVTLATTLGYL